MGKFDPFVTCPCIFSCHSGTDTSYIDNIYESISEHTKTASSSTGFTFGLGYNPTKNLQIDVLGFLDYGASILDTGFYKDLRISLTMKF